MYRTTNILEDPCRKPLNFEFVLDLLILHVPKICPRDLDLSSGTVVKVVIAFEIIFICELDKLIINFVICNYIC